MPTVSVIMTVFNGERYLREAAESIQGQTLTDLELCIVLDGCTDGSTAIARDIASNDSRVAVVELDRVGRAAALNVAVDSTTAPFLAILDADDVAYPGRLARTVNAAVELGSSFAAVACRSVVFDGELPTYSAPRGVVGILDVTVELRRRNPVAHSGLLLRRAAVEAIGGYPQRQKQIDYDLLVRLAATGSRIGLVDHIEVANRVHSERNFQSRNQTRYRWGGTLIQWKALRAIPGPLVDYGIVIGRVVLIALPQGFPTWIGRYFRTSNQTAQESLA
jgi:glycosyltransferase involved in cell wall biosynthesis